MDNDSQLPGPEEVFELPEATSTAWPRRLVVLMYHGLHDTTDQRHFDPRYSVTPQAFELQMRALLARRARAWLPGDPPGILGAPHPQAMVSFDDGDVTDHDVALRVLERLGLHAAFFVTSDFVGKPGRLSPAQLRALVAAGMHVGAHGASHAFLSELDEDELRGELLRSREHLQQILGARVDTLALPGGRGGARELRIARECGYRHVFGSVPGDNHDRDPEDIVQRVPVVRGTTPEEFVQLLGWRGLAARRVDLRHRLLQLPRRLVGDRRYDLLRQALLG